jgi:hypothetical protein
MKTRTGLLAALVTLGTITAVSASAAAAPVTAQNSPPVTAGGPRVSSNPRAYAQALKSKDWVKTPDGLMYKTCVHQVSPGAVVNADGSITSASGARQLVASCKYPRLVQPGQASPAAKAGTGISPPVTSGWLGWAEKEQDPSFPNAWLQRIWANYAVPAAPSVNGATIFIFTAFQPPYPNEESIIQPVLTYGQDATGYGGDFWYLRSWYIWNYSNNDYVGAPVPISAGQTVWGAMEGNNCNSDGTSCHWAIVTRNQSTEQESRIDIKSASAYYTAFGGALEVYNAQHCNMLPANGHIAFRNIQVWISGFNLWQAAPFLGVLSNPIECSMTVSSSATGVDILYKTS